VRAVRVRALMGGMDLTGAQRRKIKREYKAERRAAAQRPVLPNPRWRKPTIGLRARKKWTFGPPIVLHPLRSFDATGLSDMGKQKLFNLYVGMARTAADKHFARKVPVLGTGRASRLSKPELLSALAGLERHRNVQQYGVS
jgi:hypothetical protein